MAAFKLSLRALFLCLAVGCSTAPREIDDIQPLESKKVVEAQLEDANGLELRDIAHSNARMLPEAQKIDIVVAKDGTGRYTSLQEAINSAPSGTKGRRTYILVKAGNYNEKVVMPKEKVYVTIVGQGKARIFYGDSASTFGGNTMKSASFSIFAANVVLRNLIIENSFGGFDVQAVALLASADQLAFYGCTFIGKMDTLYAQIGRQYYENCKIKGSVDMIFGVARALFKGCTVQVVNNERNCLTSIAAHQRMSLSDKSGFVFLGGKIQGPLTCNRYGTVLGRAWGQYGRIIFKGVNIQVKTDRVGWTKLNEISYLPTSEFCGLNLYGPGSSTAGWPSFVCKSMNKNKQKVFLGKQWVDGESWLSDD